LLSDSSIAGFCRTCGPSTGIEDVSRSRDLKFVQAFDDERIYNERILSFASQHLSSPLPLPLPDCTDVFRAQWNVVEQERCMAVLRLAREAQVLAVVNPAGWPAEPLPVVEDGMLLILQDG
jgi:hypothetical protein